MWGSAIAVVSFVGGLLYANAGEWVLHRYVLHGVGKRKTSMWNFHWGEHHRNTRRHAHIDPDYERSVFGWHAQGKEALGILVMLAVHLPLLGWAPWFVLAVVLSGANYMRVHRRSHREPEWARNHLPWHYDHHMGRNQDANWCVSWPWFDWIMGTRVHYVRPEGREATPAPTVHGRRQPESLAP